MLQKPTGSIKTIKNYQLKRVIGKGSFANVYQALKETNGQSDGLKEFAVKEMDISPQVAEDGRMDLFKREIEILTQLHHPNIVRLHEKIDTSNYLYLVFDYCSQGDLEKYLRKNNQQKLTEAQAKSIFVQIVSALGELKRLKIVHRDLKLANILITEDFTIKLADFGFARFASADNLLESYCGTPLTMAPEILKNQYKYSSKCDMWSLGVILYQMVCGTAPFRPKAGGGIEELLKIILESEKKGFAFPATVSLSAKLKFLIQQLLQVNPIKRFSIEDVIKHDWVRDEYAQLEQERVQTSIFLKRIQSGKPEEPEMLKSEEIAVDAYEKEGNLDVSIRPIVYHTRYLIEELNRFITKLDATLGKSNYYNNPTLQQLAQHLLARNYNLILVAQKTPHRIFRDKQYYLDSLLGQFCLELYQTLITVDKQHQLECLNVLRELSDYVTCGQGLVSSHLRCDSSPNMRAIILAIKDSTQPGLASEQPPVVQLFDALSADWQVIKQNILDRDRFIMQQ